MTHGISDLTSKGVVKMSMENVMKRFFVLSVVALAALSVAVAGCASAPGSSDNTNEGVSGVPDFVNEAYLNAPADALIGIGYYEISGDWSKLDAGRAEAEKGAREDLSRQLSAIVRNMVLDYMATSETDQDIDYDAALSFELRGAQTIKMGISESGHIWVVMEFSKSEAVTEINRAVNAAKLAIPAAALDALDRMDAAFAKEAGGSVPAGE
jgi:hypothetical protein